MPGVEHVRIAEHDMRTRADRPSRIGRRIAVVGVHADRLIGRVAELVDEAVDLGHLILRQRLGRKEIQRARGGVLKNGVEDRQVVAERLARRGGRRDDDVAAGCDMRERFGLMAVELGDAAPFERGLQSRIE